VQRDDQCVRSSVLMIAKRGRKSGASAL